MSGNQSPSWRQHKAQLDHMECKGWWTLSTKMRWNICELLLHASKMIKQKFQETSTFGMIRHGLKEFGNYSWKQKFRIVCNKKFWFSFRFHNTKFLFVVASDLICWGRCGLVGKSQSMLIKFLPTILLLWFYNNKSCCYRLRWNCRKESWWSSYHRFPSLGKVVLCRRRDKRRWQWHCCHLIHSKKKCKR